MSKHAIERIESRKVLTSDVADSLTKPLSIDKIKVDQSGRKSIKFIGEKATTYVNPTNKKIATIHPTHTAVANNLKKG